MATAAFLTLLRIRQTRRKMMFVISLGAMLSAFLGFTLFDSFLSDHPLLFVAYWLFCAGLVLLMLLMAIYDFASVRGEFQGRSKDQLAAALKEIEKSARAKDDRGNGDK